MGSPQGQVPDEWANASGTPEPRTSLILHLPDELLLCIAGMLPKNQDLCQLVRVNKKLRDVAQYMLYKELFMPKKNIIELLEVLCERPDLAKKIRHVRLRNNAFRGSQDTINVDEVKTQRFRSLIDSLRGDGFYAKLVLEQEGKSAGTVDFEHYVDLLIAMSPNVTKVTMHWPSKQEQIIRSRPWAAEVNTSNSLVQPFHEGTTHLLKNNMRVLHLQHSLQGAPGTISLGTLTHLTRLSIPMDALVFSSLEPSAPEEVLPPNMRVLQLQPCNKQLIAWTSRFAIALNRGHFSELGLLEFFFKQPCLRSALLLLTLGENGDLGSFRDSLRVLFDKNLGPKIYTSTNLPAGDILNELNAWVYMSDLERWSTSVKNMKFSEAVARTVLGEPRFRTVLETRAFLRDSTWGPVIRNRRNCRIGLKSSLHRKCAPRFGEDARPKVKREDCTLNIEEWAKVLSLYTPQSNPPQSFSNELTTSKPISQPWEQQINVYESSTSLQLFANVLQTNTVSESVPAFETSTWLGTEFFPAGTVIWDSSIPNKDQPSSSSSGSPKREKGAPNRAKRCSSGYSNQHIKQKMLWRKKSSWQS